MHCVAVLQRNIYRLAVPFLGLLLAAPVLAADSNRNLAVAKAPAAATEQRVALVIGNSNYKSAPLANPENDARAVAAKLKRLGFEVVVRENLTQKQVGGVLREFRSRLRPGGVALFFYAGHGLQVKGVNYLPVVDADIASEEDVPTQSLDANKVLELMDEAKTRMNLVFLDACRNNPYARSFRSAADGLAKVNAPSGTIISFATRPGSVAADAGSGRNGLYTEHLLAAMDLPDTAIEQALKRVVSGVKQASKGRQEPWMEGSIEGDFYFRWTGQGTQALKPAAITDPLTIEFAFWESIKNSQSAEEYRAYLDQYPKGKFAALARNRIKTLNASQKPVLASAPPITTASLTPPAVATTRPTPSAGLPKEGDTWTYRYHDGWNIVPERKLTFRISAATEKGVEQVFQLDGRLVDEQTYPVEPKLIERNFLKNHQLFEFSPYLAVFEALDVGKNWQEIPYTSLASDVNAAAGPWKLSGRVVGHEKVSVPAGSFDAIKVVVTGWRQIGNMGGVISYTPKGVLYTLWYSPEVKRVVKQTILTEGVRNEIQDKDTFELVSYHLN